MSDGSGGAAAENGTPSSTGRTIVHLVHNVFTHDTRVLSEARSAAERGDAVVVAAVSGRDLPDREEAGGVQTIRFSFDPVDTRFWRNRSRVSRPWRFRRQAAGWLAARSRGKPGDRARAVIGLIGAIAALPWVAITMVYHYGLRLLDPLLRLVRLPPPSRVVGEWIEARARSVVFVGHRPLRLRDWGRRIADAVAVGDLPRADIWHADDLETLPLALGLRRRFGGRVVFDSHELFLDAAGRVRMGWFRRAILRAAERRWIVRADAVVTVNRAVAAELARRYGIAMPVVVRNCRSLWSPPPGFTSPLRAAVAAAGLDQDRPIVIAHGGFQLERGFEQRLRRSRTSRTSMSCSSATDSWKSGSARSRRRHRGVAGWRCCRPWRPTRSSRGWPAPTSRPVSSNRRRSTTACRRRTSSSRRSWPASRSWRPTYRRSPRS